MYHRTGMQKASGSMRDVECDRIWLEGILLCWCVFVCAVRVWHRWRIFENPRVASFSRHTVPILHYITYPYKYLSPGFMSAQSIRIRHTTYVYLSVWHSSLPSARNIYRYIINLHMGNNCVKIGRESGEFGLGHPERHNHLCERVRLYIYLYLHIYIYVEKLFLYDAIYAHGMLVEFASALDS